MSDFATVVRYDLKNVRRSKMLWGIVLLYVGFEAALFFAGGTGGSQTVVETLFFQVFSTALFLPLVAIAAGYLAVAGERESGTIRFVLSRPVSRLSFIFGKLLSRTLIVMTALLAGFLVGLGLAAALYPSVAVGKFVLFALLTTLFVGAYTSSAVGLSALVDSRSRAVAATVGFYFITDVLWVFGNFSVLGALQFIFKDILGLSLSERFYSFAYTLSPTGAYLKTEHFIFNPANYDALSKLEPGLPFYLEPWFAVVILVGWTVLPAAVGYLVFDSTEIE